MCVCLITGCSVRWGWQAAEIYAQTNKSFEEVTLKFTMKQQIAALKVFLTNKLDALRPSAKPQRTALCTWLTELMLQQLCKVAFVCVPRTPPWLLSLPFPS